MISSSQCFHLEGRWVVLPPWQNVQERETKHICKISWTLMNPINSRLVPFHAFLEGVAGLEGYEGYEEWYETAKDDKTD